LVCPNRCGLEVANSSLKGQEDFKMSRKASKSGYLSTFGVIFEIVKKIMDAIVYLGGNDNDLHLVLTEPNLAKQIAEVIMASRKTYKVVIDYSLSLSEMLEATFCNWLIDERDLFSLQSNGRHDRHEVELALVHLDMRVSTCEVLEYLNRQGLEPAKIEHLLAFGATYKEFQNLDIVALGSPSPIHTDRYPFLRRDYHGYWFKPVGGCGSPYWDPDWRFLAVRNEKEFA
jgi:hypothetical protein